MISPLKTTQRRRIWRRSAFTAALVCGLLAGFFGAGGVAQAAGESKGKKVLMVQSFTAHPYVATIVKSFRERANPTAWR